MKTFTRPFLLAALATASSFFAACSDKSEAPAPSVVDPTPAFKLDSYFDFVTITPAGGEAHSGFGTSHPARDIAGRAELTSQALVLDFVAGTDNPYFEVDRTKLKSNWIGNYSLRCRNRPADDVFTSYIYKVSGGSAIYRLSDFTQNLTGSISITAYDAKRQLISGAYRVEAPEQRDPTATSTTAPKCTIILTGEFENLKIKTQ